MTARTVNGWQVTPLNKTTARGAKIFKATRTEGTIKHTLFGTNSELRKLMQEDEHINSRKKTKCVFDIDGCCDCSSSRWYGKYLSDYNCKSCEFYVSSHWEKP